MARSKSKGKGVTASPMKHDIPRDFLERAGICLNQAEQCLYKGDYPTSIERTGECIELALKAAITVAGGTYSREHYTVPEDLQKVRDNFPKWIKEKLPRFALVSKVTSLLYLYTKYGYEAMQAPSKGLFSQHEAKAFVEDAREILNDCQRFLNETSEGT